MKTYYHNEKDNLFRYFFDTNIKSWTVLRVDVDGNQIADAEYCANKSALLSSFPFFKFKKHS